MTYKVDGFQGQRDLMPVLLSVAAVFGASIGENPQERHVLLVKERADAIAEHVGRCDSVLLRGELTHATRE